MLEIKLVSKKGEKKKDKISKIISGNNDSFVYLYNTLAFNSSVAYPVCWARAEASTSLRNLHTTKVKQERNCIAWKLKQTEKKKK